MVHLVDLYGKCRLNIPCVDPMGDVLLKENTVIYRHLYIHSRCYMTLMGAQSAHSQLES